ncbi:MAG: diaminopropionate ammonia-lyase [Anaerolineae bacterium]|nr:diaminopropionate ammonia-lyase [Anaerolineae bacterium]
MSGFLRVTCSAARRDCAPNRRTVYEDGIVIQNVISENFPVKWIENHHARTVQTSPAVQNVFPPGISRLARSFHRQIPGYKISPLKSLSNLAAMLGISGLWVKDESVRLTLSSFKVLGGSFAMYRFVQSRLGMDHLEIPFSELTSDAMRHKLGEITFAAATDGNHGRGVAWAAKAMGYRAVIYVHKHTSQARIKAIEGNGAEVRVVDGTYDDAVRQVNLDAQANGWQVISDTSWEGYEDIPRWVMQGYSTMLSEAQEQLAAQGIIKPTHVFVQAGVGALAASVIGFYQQLFGVTRPVSVVVEPEKAACLYKSAEAGDGKPHSFPGDLDTMMAGLACGDPSPLAWDILWDCADAFLSCPEYVAAKGMRVYGVPLQGDPFIVSGESGAVTLGALMFIMERPELKRLRDYLQLDSKSHVLLINSEGNTDPNHFRRVVWDGAEQVPAEYKEYN